MRVIYSGIADLVRAGQASGGLRAKVDPRLAAESLFAIYYFSLIYWLGGYTSKQHLATRLRAKLTIAVEGLGRTQDQGLAIGRDHVDFSQL